MRRIRTIGTVTLALILTVAAGTTPAFAQSAPVLPATADGARDHGGLLHDFGRDVLQLPSKETLTILGIGAGVSLLGHQADRNVDHQLRGDDYQFLVAGGKLGLAAVQMGAAAAVYGVARAIPGHTRLDDVGSDLLRAQLLTQALTFGSKVAVRRMRPDGGRLSFPSGHASTAFATAAVLGEHFGWRVAIPAYLAGAYVAASRVHDHRHFLSDVAFGAALGVAVGRSVTRRHPHSNFSWSPVMVPGGVGVVIERHGS